MPNIDPRELPIVRGEAAAMKGWPCGHVTCVDLNVEGDKIAATSTISPDRGKVLYDPAEVVGFIDQVKAGAWDGVYEQAQAMAASELTTA